MSNGAGVGPFDDTANRLGALALRLDDRMEQAVLVAGVRSRTAATVLSALDRFLDDPTVDVLRRVLGRSSSGMVRVIDGLEADGLVIRRGGDDGRVTTISMTAKGRRAATVIVSARQRVLADALSPLADDERAALAPILDKVLVGLVQGPAPGPLDVPSLRHRDVWR